MTRRSTRTAVGRGARALVAMTALASGLAAATIGLAGPGIGAGRGAGVGLGPDNDSYTSDVLTGVSAISPTDVWIVGNHPSARSDYQPVVRRFDGTTWTRMGNLHLHGTFAYPTSVQALSDDDVWVSLSTFSTGPSYVSHWNGSAWQTWLMPGGTELYHLWVDTDSDVWAVGGGPDVEHFDGTTWQTLHSPAPAGAELFGVSGSGPDDVWMAGRFTSGGFGYENLFVHWDGSRWFVKAGFSQPGGGGLEGVDVVSPTLAWAAGWYTGDSSSRGLTMHWNGTHWADSFQQVLPNDYLLGVSAESATDVWVVGHGSDGRAVAGHWNGHAWKASTPRSPGTVDNSLLSVSADAPDDVWAVGSFYSGGASYTRMIEHYDGTRWVSVRQP